MVVDSRRETRNPESRSRFTGGNHGGESTATSNPAETVRPSYTARMGAVLVFDGDCGFCTACVEFTRRWIRPRVNMQPWQFLNLADYGLTEEQCAEAVQFVATDGRIHSGSRAVTGLLRTANRPWPWIAALADSPGIAPIAASAYRLVARNRYRLPGSTPACAVSPR